MLKNLFTVLAALAFALRPVRGQTLNDFFDDSVMHEIRLQIAPADWQALHDRYLDNTYYRCEFAWRDIHLADVGVRSRGSGTRNPIKPNLGFDFSRYNGTQRFLSLKALVTRNFAQDPSMAREFLAMKVFARMGLPALRESFARVVVNGEYAGLYLMVEPIDKRYLLTHFGEDTGYLYEGKFVEPPYHFEYLGEDPQLYLPNIFEPKTHEDAPEAARLIEMIRKANETAPGAYLVAMDEYIDADQFVAHLAVEQFLAENDGLLGYGGMTNYYLYRRMSDNRFVLLPWDKDNTFSLSDRSIWRNVEQNVLFGRLLEEPGLRQRYLQTVRHAGEVAGGAYGWLYFEYERVYQLIREPALADPVRVCVLEDGIGRCQGPEFEIQHGYLLSFMGSRLSFADAEATAGGLVTDAEAPSVRAGAVGSLASGHSVLVPGGLARLGMTSSLRGTVWASTQPLPVELQGLHVSVGGKDAPLWMAGPWEIYFQTPWDVCYGAQTLRVTWQGHADHSVDVEVRPADAGVFSVTHANWVAVSAQAPARAGEWVVAWGTGFGMTRTRQVTGAPSPPDAVLASSEVIAAVVDGRPAAVHFAGMAPGLIGVSQVIVEMPGGLGKGRVPLLFTVGDEPGAPYWIEVQP